MKAYQCLECGNVITSNRNIEGRACECGHGLYGPGYTDPHLPYWKGKEKAPLLHVPSHPSWNAQSSDVRELLGLGRQGKLPAEGMPTMMIQGVEVYVLPVGSPGLNPKATRPHRVRAVCPKCSYHMSAGRLFQHKCEVRHG